MATWEDGPEYAPIARPAGFDAPEVGALEIAPRRELLSAGAPVQRPVFEQRHPVSPLADHQPRPSQQRDPQQAFEVASTVMTDSSSSAWGAVHSPLGYSHTDPSWSPPSGPPPARTAMPHPDEVIGPPIHDPHQAFHLTGGQRHGLDFPAPDGSPIAAPASPEQLANYPAPQGFGPDPQGFGPGPQGFGPGPQQRPATASGLGRVLAGVTLPTTVALLIGGLSVALPLFAWLSPLSFGAAFLTSGRIGYRRGWVRNLFLAGSSALVMTLVVGVMSSLDDLLVAYDLVCQLSAVICWLTLLTLMAMVKHAQSRGEQPEPPTRDPDPGWG